MEVRILGTLDVIDGSRRVDLGGPRQRLLLARLAVVPSSVVAVDALIDELWLGQPPAGAKAALQSQVSRLRRSLRWPESVVARHSGYALQLDADHLDAFRFEQLLTQARVMLRKGELATASALLAEAEDRWRGPALTEFRDYAFALAEGARLDELRLLAREMRIEAQLRLGCHSEVVPELEQLVSGYPLRERFWSQLIVALYRSGRQADALRTYAELRSILREELGITPSVELQRLEEAVLQQSSKLDCGQPQVATPAPAHGSGVQTDSIGTGRPKPAASGSSPLVRAIAGPILGRDPELARLRAVWKKTRGSGNLILIAGEAGIGKTRLVAELGRLVENTGAVVLYGRCSEDRLVPYEPFVEALNYLIEVTPEEALRGYLADRAGDLARLLPEIGVRLERAAPRIDGDPELERLRLFEAVVALVGRAARRSPTLLVLDDLHWADRATIGLLRRLVRVLDRTPVLVVGTFRQSELDTDHPLRPFVVDSHRERDVERVVLGGLDDEAILVLVELASHGSASMTTLATRLRRETAGNPFFLREILHSLPVERLRLDEKATAERLNLPLTIHEAVGRRLNRLSPSTQQALAVAAVGGHEFDMRIVAQVIHATDGEILNAVDEATAAQLIYEVTGAPSRFSFTHGLTRSAIYHQLSSARQVYLHWQIAQVLESIASAGDGASRLGELAHHYAKASPVAGSEKAVEYAIKAGEQSRSVYALDEAIDYYCTALHLLRGSSMLASIADVLLVLGELYEWRGDYENCARIYAELKEVSDDPRAAQGLATALRSQGLLSKALEVLRDALATERSPIGRALLWLECSRTYIPLGDVRAAMKSARSALADLHGQDKVLAGELLVHLARIHYFKRDFHAALRTAQEAQALLIVTANARSLSRAAEWVGAAASELDLHKLAIRSLHEALALAQRIGAVQDVASCLGRLGKAESRRDQSNAAVEYFGRAIAILDRIGHAEGRAIVYENYGRALDRAGRYDEALEVCIKALDLAKVKEDAMGVMTNTQAIALIRLHQGCFDEAAQLAAESARRFAEGGVDAECQESLRIAQEAKERANQEVGGTRT